MPHMKYRLLLFCTIATFSLIFFIPTALALTPQGDIVKLVNPIGGTSTTPRGIVDPSMILGLTVNYALGLIGSITLAVFVYGGFVWLTSGGNPDRVKAGTRAMTWAIVGLLVVFASYAILNTILEGIGARGFNNSGV